MTKQTHADSGDYTYEKPEQHYDGEWAISDPRSIFVRGAKWHHYATTGATMFASDVDAAEAEAERRYALGQFSQPLQEGVMAAVGGSKVVISRAAYDAMMTETVNLRIKASIIEEKLAACEHALKLAHRQTD